MELLFKLILNVTKRLRRGCEGPSKKNFSDRTVFTRFTPIRVLERVETVMALPGLFIVRFEFGFLLPD